MPTVILTRDLVADIKNQRSGDYLVVDHIDPDEYNIPKLTRLLGRALQVTRTLKVLELVEPLPELVTLVAHALNQPHCRLESLILKGMKKPGLAEIVRALSHFPVDHVTMRMAGIVGTSCQTLIITLSATPFAVMELTSLHINQFITSGLPILCSPILDAPANPALNEEPRDAPPQPDLNNHALSVSSRWDQSSSQLLWERVRPAFLAKRFEESETVSPALASLRPRNPWTDFAVPLPPLVGLSEASRPQRQLNEAPISMTGRWSSILSASSPASNALNVTTVKPVARLSSEEQPHTRLNGPINNAHQRGMDAYQPALAPCALHSHLVSAFSPSRTSPTDLLSVPMALAAINSAR